MKPFGLLLKNIPLGQFAKMSNCAGKKIMQMELISWHACFQCTLLFPRLRFYSILTFSFVQWKNCMPHFLSTCCVMFLKCDAKGWVEGTWRLISDLTIQWLDSHNDNKDSCQLKQMGEVTPSSRNIWLKGKCISDNIGHKDMKTQVFFFLKACCVVSLGLYISEATSDTPSWMWSIPQQIFSNCWCFQVSAIQCVVVVQQIGLVASLAKCSERLPSKMFATSATVFRDPFLHHSLEFFLSFFSLPLSPFVFMLSRSEDWSQPHRQN